MSPQTYPGMGLGVGGGAARFLSAPGPTPPGGDLPTGALNTSDLHLERRETSGTFDCPGSLQNVHICSATSGVHSQTPCGQHYCRETVNVSINLPSNGAGGGGWGRQVSFISWPHPPRRTSPHQRKCSKCIWSAFEREEYKSTHTSGTLLITEAHCRMYILCNAITHAPENTYILLVVAVTQRRPHSLTMNQYEFLGKKRQDTSIINTSLKAQSSNYAAMNTHPVAITATSLSLLAEIHRQMHLRCLGRRWLLVNWFCSSFVLSN